MYNVGLLQGGHIYLCGNYLDMAQIAFDLYLTSPSKWYGHVKSVHLTVLTAWSKHYKPILLIIDRFAGPMWIAT